MFVDVVSIIALGAIVFFTGMAIGGLLTYGFVMDVIDEYEAELEARE